MELTHEYIRSILGQRPEDSHKGKNGRGLLIAGGSGMYGAAVMSACAALRSGIGTLKVFCPAPAAAALSELPEAMALSNGSEGWEAFDGDRLKALAEQADCIAFGPGMGAGVGQERALGLILGAQKPTVIDADGLNALARMDGFAQLHERVVLTPHPGEMARLSGLPTAEIVNQPGRIALDMAKRWRCTVLLKGARSHIASMCGRSSVNTTGNPGLAKGGSGDVLTGIILAMLGQGLQPFEAAQAGAYLLGASADKAVDILRERMLMARDVTHAVELTLREGF